MNHLEVRRHGRRKDGGGSQLSQDQARASGFTMGPFACVVTTVVPRARETAITMGFAVDLRSSLRLSPGVSPVMAHPEPRLSTVWSTTTGQEILPTPDQSGVELANDHVDDVPT